MTVEQAAGHWLFQLAVYFVFALWALMFGIKRFLAARGVRVGWQDARAQLAQLRRVAEAGGEAGRMAQVLRTVLQVGVGLWLVVALLLVATFLGIEPL